MGMFDYLKCEMPLPPGTPEELEWQTKSLGCGMDWLAIKPDGTLVNRHLRMEPKPGTPPSPGFMSDEYLAWHSEWYESKEGPDEPLDYTGEVRFYAMAKDKTWWEFCAFCKQGNCFEIVQIIPAETQS